MQSVPLLQEGKSLKNSSLQRFQVDNDWDAYFPDNQSPEKNLVTAIMERAVADLFHKDAHVRRDANQWFKSNTPDMEFSFLWCLETLDKELNASSIRKEVLRLKAFSFQHRRRKSQELSGRSLGEKLTKFRESKYVTL